MKFAVLNKFLSKYQYHFFIIITIILTYQNIIFFRNLIIRSQPYYKQEIKADNSHKKSRKKVLDLKISNCKLKTINGKYSCLSTLFNDSYIFKHQEEDYWIFKKSVVDEDNTYHYWVLSNVDPNKDSTKILYDSINIINIGNTQLWHYIDYGIIPIGIFYNINNREESININIY